MKLLSVFAMSLVAATPLFAEGTRQLDAHEHGVGALNIAFDGQKVAMEFHAPGADIVGFEYPAKSAEDRTAVDAAVAKLAAPLDLFVIPQAAGCSVVQANAELEGEGAHEEHEEHADHADHDDHEDHADHDDHSDKASHTEFHAEYMLTCADPAAVSEIAFAYFDAFPNAVEVEVQIISDQGATAFEVERGAPVLDLKGMF